jgi:valyl-tRNA synthetase
MLDLLATLMRLMHPFVSFITEEIYGKLPNTTGHIIDAAYPVYCDENRYPDAKNMVDAMQEFVRGVRSLRSELQIGAERKLHVSFRPDTGFVATDFVKEHIGLISTFIGASRLDVDTEHTASIEKAVPVAGPGFEAFVFVRDAIDVEQEISRIEEDLAKTEKSLEGTLKKLSNEQFIANAKEVAIEKEKGKRTEFEEKLEKGRKHLQLLRSL